MSDSVPTVRLTIDGQEVTIPAKKLAYDPLSKKRVEIDATVYDECADSDCNGCCTENAHANGLDFLIDIEKYTMQRFGSGDGIVDWMCLDCP